MSSLGQRFIRRTRFNDILLRVSGDRSYGYYVVPRGEHTNVGLSFGTRKRAEQYAKQTGKKGWHEQVSTYRGWHSKYFLGNQDKKYEKLTGRTRIRVFPKRKLKLLW